MSEQPQQTRTFTCGSKNQMDKLDRPLSPTSSRMALESRISETKILQLNHDADVEEFLLPIAHNTHSRLVRVQTVDQLSRYTDDHSSGCVVVDPSTLGETGASELAKFMNDYPDFPVVVWSSQLDVKRAVDFMKCGALDVLRRPTSDRELAASVKNAIRVGQQRSAKILERRQVLSRFEELSANEKVVLELVLQGKTNKEIAGILECSLRTIEARRHRIQRIMRAENAIEVAVTLTAHGIVVHAPASPRSETDDLQGRNDTSDRMFRSNNN